VRARVIGSVLVVVVGLVPVLVGGPVFALLMMILGVAGYREFLELAGKVSLRGIGSYAQVGYLVVIALGCVALFHESAVWLLAATFLAVVAPLVLLFSNPTFPDGFSGWSLASAGSLYVGLPIYAAIAIRASSGVIDAPWLSEASQRLAFGWHPAPRGLAWALTVILVIWAADSVAFLAGRAFGRQKLAPAISPNKSWEGAIAGIVASMAVATVSFRAFGLGGWWLGLVAGAVIGLTGQIGDLAESVLKRQAGVKDSGSIIPGHGGVLDRIDALLFAFPAGFLMAVGLERFGT